MTRLKQRAKPVRWFVAGVFVAGPDSEDDPLSSMPRDANVVVHAKAMGTVVSACGLPAGSWTKLWHLSFERVSSQSRCEACWNQVRAHTSAEPARVCC